MLPVYNKAEAAIIAGVSERQIGRFIENGYFRAERSNGRSGMWLIERKEFDKWVADGMPRVPRQESPREIARRMMRAQRESLGIPS